MACGGPAQPAEGRRLGNEGLEPATAITRCNRANTPDAAPSTLDNDNARPRVRPVENTPSPRPVPRRTGGATEGLRKQFVAQPSNHRQPEPAYPLAPALTPGPGATLEQDWRSTGAGPSPSRMLSSRLIGRARAHGPTPLYTLTPLRRLGQPCRPPVLTSSRPPSLAFPSVTLPSPPRGGITAQPTLPSQPQFPHPLSTHAPRPPDVDQPEKHLRTMKDPVARAASPYSDPSVKGPHSQLLASGHFSAVNSKSLSLSLSPPPKSVRLLRRPQKVLLFLLRLGC